LLCNVTAGTWPISRPTVGPEGLANRANNCHSVLGNRYVNKGRHDTCYRQDNQTQQEHTYSEVSGNTVPVNAEHHFQSTAIKVMTSTVTFWVVMPCSPVRSTLKMEAITFLRNVGKHLKTAVGTFTAVRNSNLEQDCKSGRLLLTCHPEKHAATEFPDRLQFKDRKTYASRNLY